MAAPDDTQRLLDEMTEAVGMQEDAQVANQETCATQALLDRMDQMISSESSSEVEAVEIEAVRPPGDSYGQKRNHDQSDGPVECELQIKRRNETSDSDQTPFKKPCDVTLDQGAAEVDNSDLRTSESVSSCKSVSESQQIDCSTSPADHVTVTMETEGQQSEQDPEVESMQSKKDNEKRDTACELKACVSISQTDESEHAVKGQVTSDLQQHVSSNMEVNVDTKPDDSCDNTTRTPDPVVDNRSSVNQTVTPETAESSALSRSDTSLFSSTSEGSEPVSVLSGEVSAQTDVNNTSVTVNRTPEEVGNRSEKLTQSTEPVKAPGNAEEGKALELKVDKVVESSSDEGTEVFLSPTHQQHSWKADFSRPPIQLTGCWTEFDVVGDNFLKGCKWSPDGSCILTNSDDNCMRLFNLPTDLQPSSTDVREEMTSVLRFQEGSLIYDYCWYPLMNSSDAATCCLVSTSQSTPIHMWDAYTGEIRCTYRAFDHLDELVAANSVAFSPDGMKLYCGFNKMIRVFDTTRPGRQFMKRPTYVKQGQPGIISCIAVNPDKPKMYAAGSYSRSVAIYTEPHGNMSCMFQGQQGGVTHIAFSPDGNQLLTGGRKDPEILAWDVRNPGQLLYTANRQVYTNQRIYFDIDSSGEYLLSGNHDGSVYVWDTKTYQSVGAGDQEPVLQPTLTFQAHGDACNGISLHPTLPVLATASGQRKFPLPAGEESDSDAEQAEAIDNSLRLWWLGPPGTQG